jgi:hypothetical protein
LQIKTDIVQQLTDNKELIISSLDKSESNIKLYINETNELHENSIAAIDGKIDETKRDITGLINTSNSGVVDLINTSKSEVVGLINTSNSGVVGLINATKDEINASNTFISEKITTIKSDITDLINTTKAELESNISASQKSIVDLLNSDVINGTQNQLIHNLIISETVAEIIEYYSNFISGNFSQVSSQLTVDKFNKLSLELYKLKSILPDNSDYEIVRNIIVKSFEALMQIINQQLQFIVLQNSYNVISEKASILDDMSKLRDYIATLSNSASLVLISDVTVDAPAFGLNPEIQKYIDLYGFPEGGVFDSNKLAIIIDNM